MSNRSNKWRQVGGRNRNANYNMVRIPLYTNWSSNNHGLTGKANAPEIVDGKVILRDNIGIAGALDISGSCSGVTSTNDSGYEFATLDWVNQRISGIQHSLLYLNELTQHINETKSQYELQKQSITDISSNNIISGALIEDVIQKIDTIQQSIIKYNENVSNITMNTATNYSVNEMSKNLHNTRKILDQQKTEIAKVTTNSVNTQSLVRELKAQMNKTTQLINNQTVHNNQTNHANSLVLNSIPIIIKDVDSLSTQINNTLKLIEQHSNDINIIGLHMRSNEDVLFNKITMYDTRFEQNESLLQSTLLKTSSQEKQLKVLNRTIQEQTNNINYIKDNIVLDTLLVSKE